MKDLFDSLSPGPAPGFDSDPLAAPYKAWAASPKGPADNAAVLQAMGPHIDKAARAHVGEVNPIIRSRARQMALTGLATFDPNKGTRVSSHLHNHLQGLKRYNAQLAQGVRIPERVVLDRRTLDGASRELGDDLGRDPTDDELSEHTGLSGRRIASIRRGAGMSVNTGRFAGIGEDGSDLTPAVNAPENDAWLPLLYDDLSDTDKIIFEHTVGWQGKPKLGTGQLAERLRVTPGRVSQRKLEIQRQLDQMQEYMP